MTKNLNYKQPLNEPELRDLQSHDEKKFIEVLFRTYYAALCRFVNNLIKDREKSEDLVQDVFVKIWNHRNKLDPKQPIKAYLYKSAYHTTLNYLEKNKKNVFIDDYTPYDHHLKTESADQLSYQEVESQVKKAIDGLPLRCKAVFLLSREKELSYREIAETMEISVKTVENQMSKALSILRDRLNPYLDQFMITLIWLYNIF